MPKPIVRIHLTPPYKSETFPTSTGLVEWKVPKDQYWVVDCHFVTFEGAKRFKQFNSMHKVKALYKAYEWLKEQHGLDEMIQREVAKKKDHRSEAYAEKPRLYMRSAVNTEGYKRYRITWREKDNNSLHIVYGNTPEAAYEALLESIIGTRNAQHDLEEYYAPSKHKPWWKRWFS